MKILVYKKRGKTYECTDIKDSAEKRCKIIFDEPLDAKIKLGDVIVPLSHGVAEFDVCDIGNGEHSPILISYGRAVKMEAFIIKDGGVSRPLLSEDYLRSLSTRLEECCEIIDSLEERIAELERKMENTINF